MTRAYLDTCVLNYWRIYRFPEPPLSRFYHMPKRRKRLPPPKAQSSLSLFDNMEEIDCTLVTSDLAMVEMTLILTKSLRRKTSDAWAQFQHQERTRMIQWHIPWFAHRLEEIQVQVLPLKMNPRHLIELISVYSADPPDALHICSAIESKCEYFVTIDKRLKERFKPSLLLKYIRMIDPHNLLSKVPRKTQS